MDKYDSEDETRVRPGGPVDIGRLLQALRRHWRVLPVAAALGSLIGFGVSALWLESAYTARATLLWEPPSSAQPSDRSFLTQVDSIKLPVNLIEVRKRLNSKLTLEELKQKISLVFDNQSHLVVVEFTDATGRAAARGANTVVDVFLDYERRVGRSRGSERVQTIETDLTLARDQLAQLRAGFERFRNQHGVSDFAIETAAAIGAVARTQEEAAAARTEALTEERKARELAEQLRRTPRVLESGGRLSNPVEIELAQLRGQLLAHAHLAPEHPTILRLRAAIQALEGQRARAPLVQDSVDVSGNPLYQSLESQLSEANVARAAALAREQTAQAAHERAERRLQQLTAAGGEAQQFSARIQLLETHVNGLEAQRALQSDGVRNAVADFRVVTAAGVPEQSNPSKRRALALQFPLAALALALLGIIGRELRGLRVHTALETAFWANAPVVASSTWPREHAALRGLVDELSDVAPTLRGTTLVVGGRAQEAPLAREVAYWLSHLASNSQLRALGTGSPAAESPRGAINVDFAGELATVESVGQQPFGSSLARRRADACASAWAWDGPMDGLSLRRAARLADRVLVVVVAGSLSISEAAHLRTSLGRTSGIGLLLVGLNPEFVRLPDRAGEAEHFWTAQRA